MSVPNPAPPPSSTQTHDADLVLPFAALDRGALAIAGGKAANLGELTRAGLPVPPGFCVTTTAYAQVAAGADLEPVLAALAATPAGDTARLAELATQARAALLAAPMPASVAAAIADAYSVLGNGAAPPVAVRSSATAEDLPFASFAGQQDTYLNIVGANAVRDAVRRCWASLWTDRAVSYRASNGIDHRTVRLAVVIQRMIEAVVSGIMFTANPLTGRRRQTVIDASPGLGEAVVSGAVNPDHFVVNTASGEIVERRLGDKRLAIRPIPGGGTERVEQADGSAQACLSDDQIRALAALGARVEAHYGAPQDTEWALDADGLFWLTQARPITTLFPLPASAPTSDAVLRVYFSFNVAQGVFQPLTPMGAQAFRLFGTAIAMALGRPPRDPYTGPATLVEVGHRLFIDATPALRSSFGRSLVGRALGAMEARTAAIFGQLAGDPRLAVLPTPRWLLFRRVSRLLIRTRFPPRILHALLRPAAARAQVARLQGKIVARARVPRKASAAARLNAVDRVLRDFPLYVMPRVASLLLAALFANMLAARLLRGLATDDERQAVLRGLPHNLTTEMDLELWALSQRVRTGPAAVQALRATPPEQLARDYHAGTLPPALQEALAGFLRVYGHRAVAEIDLGLPRWSENPTHILGVLANYLQLENPDLAPDVQFRRAAESAEAMVAELTRRARRRGRLRGALVGFLLGRVRALMGMRESPKFLGVVLLTQVRTLLQPVGAELARARRLDAPEDIFFMTLPEARAALAGADPRATIHERHASYDLELRRRHVPRVLLSDGTEPEGETQAAATTGRTLQGTPASAGEVTARARVILDPTGARLEPGEILVAPSTDPGWTPLFLTAAGLVMEMGGAMSHGAVVAREYGIPAVVGVPGATERISTGQRITVNGSAGTVTIEEDDV
jgi:phosphohistidine swiveling domain-containing protein